MHIHHKIQLAPTLRVSVCEGWGLGFSITTNFKGFRAILSRICRAPKNGKKTNPSCIRGCPIALVLIAAKHNKKLLVCDCIVVLNLRVSVYLKCYRANECISSCSAAKEKVETVVTIHFTLMLHYTNMKKLLFDKRTLF